MAFPTTSVIDSGSGTDGTLTGWTTAQALFDGAYRSAATNTGLTRLTNKLKAATGGWQLSYRTSESPSADCEVFGTIDVAPADGDEVILHARMGGGLDSTWAGYRLLMLKNAGNDFGLRIAYILEGNPVTLTTIASGFTYSAGMKLGMSVVGNVINGYLYSGGSWNQTPAITYTDSSANVPSAGKIGLEIRNTTARVTDFGGGSVVSGPTLDNCLPDADVVTTGWTTAPLFSKVNDASDSTVIQATAV